MRLRRGGAVMKLLTGSRLSYQFAAAAVVLLAVVTVATDAPAPARIICLPILIVAPGAALLTLMFGRARPSALGPHVPAPLDHGDQPVLRLPLSVLLGILLALFATLALHIVGIRITATTLALAIGAVTGVVSIVALWRSRIRSADVGGAACNGCTGETASDTTRIVRAGRGAAPVLCSATVLVLAVIIACAIAPHHEDQYTTLSFVDSKPFAGERPTVAAGSPVHLNWVIRAFGYQFSGGLTGVQVRIDGIPIEDSAVDLGAVSAPDIVGASGVLTGAVTFPAPRTPGRHAVELTAFPASDGGTDLPEPGFISTFVEVEQ
jgi:hypothetical protein